MKPYHLLRIRSIRLRLTLLSLLVSGLTLTLFGGLIFVVVQRSSLKRIDEDVKEFAYKHLSQDHGPKHWDRFSDSLRFFLGDEENNAFILLVKGRRGVINFRSSNWPGDLPEGDFPAPEAWESYSEETPPPPAQRPKEKAYRSKRPPSSRPPAPNNSPPFERPRKAAKPGPLKPPRFFTRHAAGAAWRIGLMGNAKLTIALGLNMNRINREMDQLEHTLALLLPLALLVVAIGSWWTSRRALKPIETIADTIERVKSQGFDQRILSQEEDREFAKLIDVFNEMMDWIEKSFHQAIRFSADASHELKTPLTVLQTQLEQAVHEAETGSDEQRRYVVLAKELQRLKSVTQKLMLLARIDAGELKLNLRPLNLSEVVEGIVEDSEALAPQLHIESKLPPNLWIMGDEDLMKQVVQNLVANAMKYNAKGGFIRFRLQANETQLCLSIANSGKAIPREEHDLIFTRFYRVDKARNQRVGGAGLGLSLAREIVRAHDGELLLKDSSQDATVFSMTLPHATASL